MEIMLPLVALPQQVAEVDLTIIHGALQRV